MRWAIKILAFWLALALVSLLVSFGAAKAFVHSDIPAFWLFVSVAAFIASVVSMLFFFERAAAIKSHWDCR